ncbi:MAG: YbfB/YjiJ family MFS transporter [Deltaproteobacteria bacterium]|nr:YbfB/YjiJ family MFS transporter [Deltaproteobacteria bacterium]
MQSAVSAKPAFHYGWVIVSSGMLCIFACLGFGRFALGMLLPSMAATLNLSYSQMGFISTANFLGYLVSVLLSGHWAGRIGSRKLIFVALLVVGVSMSMVSGATGFLSVLVLYMITGIGSGAANVPVMGLVSAWFASSQRGRAAGFIVIGSGFAIMISGRLIPFLNRLIGPEGWRTSWLILSGFVVLIAFISLALLRDRPADKGLKPIGSDDAVSSARRCPEGKDANVYREGIIYYLGIIYFLFGYTYVIYATFIVTTLVRERGFSESVAGSFWMWVGFLSLFSGPVFGTLSDRLSRKAGLIIVFSLQAISYLLIATGLPGLFLYLSIGFYGLVAWSIPSIMAAAIGDYVGARKAAAAIGLVTFIFGLGQISGPAIAGMLAERTGSFSSSFSMAAVFAGIAILLTSFLRKPTAGGGSRKTAPTAKG